MPDKEEQADELLALQSIYSDDILVIESTGVDNVELKGKIYCMIDLPTGLRLQVKDSDERHAVSHLPPITLKFSMPHDYPSTSPPTYNLSAPWLDASQLEKLSQELDRLWSENHGMVIIFTWTSFLQFSTFELLGLGTNIIISTDLLNTLLDFEKDKSKEEFAGKLFTCEVCFRDRTGSGSIQFEECGHVYCKECMREHFSTQIRDGSVKRLMCPQDGCKTLATTEQVKELVSSDLFERYDQLLLQLSLDTMSDLKYCPRKGCAYPVEIDRKDGLGRCPSCSFTFCTYCDKTYHYPAKCAITNVIELRDKYVNASEAEKAELDKRYGKRQIQEFVQSCYTAQWMEKYSKQCPHCRAQIQKIDGCNKMACMKCNSYFCWLCLEVLPHDKPYAHFNNPSSRCFDKLFQGVQRDDDDDDNGDIEWETDDEITDDDDDGFNALRIV